MDSSMVTKWWDYRLVDEETATLMFILSYAKIVSEYNERCGRSRHMNLLKGFCLDNPQLWGRNYATLRNLRCWCDKQGTRYDEYWQWAVEIHETLGFHNYFVTTYACSAVKERVIIKQAENRRVFIPVSQHPFFRSAGYKGCLLQDAYFTELTRTVRDRYGATAIAVTKRMVDDGIIPWAFFCPKESPHRGITDDLSEAKDGPRSDEKHQR
jgi:hypothetical protein